MKKTGLRKRFRYWLELHMAKGTSSMVKLLLAVVLFMAAVLLFLKVPPLYTAITIVVIVGLIYFAFQKFLGVKLPTGTLLKALSK